MTSERRGCRGDQWRERGAEVTSGERGVQILIVVEKECGGDQWR